MRVSKISGLPTWVFLLAMVTDVFDLLNLAGISTIGGYAITKPVTITLNIIVLVIIGFYKGFTLDAIKVMLLESLPFVEYFPIATLLVASESRRRKK